jgi:hypothetical protein
VFSSVNSSPAKDLAKSSTETFSWSEGLAALASASDGSCYWTDLHSGHWFGVKIHAPVQIFTIGTAPYYLVSYWNGDESTSEREWLCPVDEPPTVYDFPDTVQWKIRIHPTAAHTTLQLAVAISDK